MGEPVEKCPRPKAGRHSVHFSKAPFPYGHSVKYPSRTFPHSPVRLPIPHSCSLKSSPKEISFMQVLISIFFFRSSKTSLFHNFQLVPWHCAELTECFGVFSPPHHHKLWIQRNCVCINPLHSFFLMLKLPCLWSINGSPFTLVPASFDMALVTSESSFAFCYDMINPGSTCTLPDPHLQSALSTWSTGPF